MGAVLDSVLGTAKCKEVTELSQSGLMKTTKDTLANLVFSLAGVLSKSGGVLRAAAVKIEVLKSDQILNQKTVIKLQDEILQSNDKQADAVRATVKTEIRSFSDVVSQNCSDRITPKKLQSVVKSAVNSEERSRSVMVFGLPEGEVVQGKTVYVDDQMDKLLCNFDYKPRMRECYRVGIQKPGFTRPVRVTLTSPDAVAEILKESKRLKGSPVYSMVFISPDRTPEERAARRKLVDALKKKVQEQPDKHHYIRSGTVCSMDKQPVAAS